MAEERKYSWNELVAISNDIDSVLKKAKSKKDEDGNEKKVGLDRILTFKLRSNQKKANEAIEQIEENFPEKNETYDAYVEERIKIIREFGGDVQSQGGRIFVPNYKELEENRNFVAKMDELESENEEIIQSEDARQKTIMKEQREKSAVVSWMVVSLDLFPEEVDGDDFPLSFLEFVHE